MPLCVPAITRRPVELASAGRSTGPLDARAGGLGRCFSGGVVVSSTAASNVSACQDDRAPRGGQDERTVLWLRGLLCWTGRAMGGPSEPSPGWSVNVCTFE